MIETLSLLFMACAIIYYIVIIPIIAATIKERCRTLNHPITAEPLFSLFKGSKLWKQSRVVLKKTSDPVLKSIFIKMYFAHAFFFLLFIAGIFLEQ